jgi:hypothetical protein
MHSAAPFFHMQHSQRQPSDAVISALPLRHPNRAPLRHHRMLWSHVLRGSACIVSLVHRMYQRHRLVSLEYRSGSVRSCIHRDAYARYRLYGQLNSGRLDCTRAVPCYVYRASARFYFSRTIAWRILCSTRFVLLFLFQFIFMCSAEI